MFTGLWFALENIFRCSLEPDCVTLDKSLPSRLVFFEYIYILLNIYETQEGKAR